MTAWLHTMIIYHSWAVSGLLSLMIGIGSALIAAWMWFERMK